MAVLNFVPKNSINEKQVRLAEYFASQEIRDFEETISILKENSSLSYLFNNLDFDQVAEAVMKTVREAYYKDNKLTPKAVEEINKLYGERFDIDEFYEQYLK